MEEGKENKDESKESDEEKLYEMELKIDKEKFVGKMKLLSV